MSRLVLTSYVLMIPALAWADVAPDGGGCRCSTAELGMAALPIIAVAGLALFRRFRRGC